MLSQMREKNFIKTILWLVVFAFIATTVFVWGADLQGSGCGTAAPRGQQWLATIGDQPLSYRDFDQRFRQRISDLYSNRPQDAVISEDEKLRLRDQVYEQMVNEAMFALEAERLGLTPSDEEIADVLYSNPPELLRRQFTGEDGVFDREAYNLALANPSIDWRPFEEMVRQSLPIDRLRQMISSRIVISEAELKHEYELKEGKRRVLHAGLVWRNVQLEVDDPGDDILGAYLDSHAGDFQTPQRLLIQGVAFSRDPSADDEAFVHQRLDWVREQIVTGGRDFADMAREYSQDPSNAEAGGDLGWFAKGRMVPVFEEAAFALSDGELSQPIRSRFGLHLIKREGMRETDGETEVHARHILMLVEPSYATQDSVSALADTLLTTAKLCGDLAEAAADIGLDFFAPEAFSEFEPVGEIGFAPAIKSVAKQLEPGQISYRFSDRDSDYVIQVLEKIAPATPSLEEQRDQVLRHWQENEKKQTATDRMAAVLAHIQSGKSLARAAELEGVEVKEPTPFSHGDYIPEVGSESAYHDVAFLLAVNEVSGLIDTGSGSWILELLEITEAPEDEYDSKREGIQQEVLSRRQQDYFSQWMEELKSRYEVVDLRPALVSN